jgi:hypothetical protein
LNFAFVEPKRKPAYWAGKVFLFAERALRLPLLFQISMSENMNCCVSVVVSIVFYPKPGWNFAHEKMCLVAGVLCLVFAQQLIRQCLGMSHKCHEFNDYSLFLIVTTFRGAFKLFSTPAIFPGKIIFLFKNYCLIPLED